MNFTHPSAAPPLPPALPYPPKPNPPRAIMRRPLLHLARRKLAAQRPYAPAICDNYRARREPNLQGAPRGQSHSCTVPLIAWWVKRADTNTNPCNAKSAQVYTADKSHAGMVEDRRKQHTGSGPRGGASEDESPHARFQKCRPLPLETVCYYGHADTVTGQLRRWQGCQCSTCENSLFGPFPRPPLPLW